MSALTITHTTENGTLIEGTCKGDGSGEVLKRHGWRWHGDCGWYIRGSRGHLPRRATIDQTVAALQAAGFEVAVELDDTPADPGKAEQQRRARATERAKRLTERAEKAEKVAEARDAAARQIGDGIPFGQPILVGHHSEGRHRRDLDRMQANSRQAYEARQEAERLRQAAQAAQANSTPVGKVTLGNRIQTLTTDLRREERMLAKQSDPTSRAASVLGASVERLRAQLDYERTQWDQRVAAGEFVAYGPELVKAGDLVQVNNSWRRVVKANKATCTLETSYSWTDRVEWHKVTDHRATVVAGN